MSYLDDDPGAARPDLPNIVPMVEIFLFLLLAAMTGLAGSARQLDVRLAEAAAADKPSRPAPRPLRVSITAGDELRVGGHPVTDAELADRLAGLAPNTVVVVSADRKASVEVLARVFGLCKQAGRPYRLSVNLPEGRP